MWTMVWSGPTALYLRRLTTSIIVQNRQISHYERVLAFLENTHTLLPTLVPAIKHMKITFGLKTMV
uniref:Uncharacterized protein n=1 Tax=Neogobius melanostomus TaxID=47308 RepID=A0A8C6UXC7_9GOBI